MEDVSKLATGVSLPEPEIAQKPPEGGSMPEDDGSPMTDHEIPVGFLCGINNFLTISHRRSHWLFQKDVFSRRQCSKRGSGVLVPHGHDADRVEFRISQQFTIIGKSSRYVELISQFFQPGFRPRAECIEFNFRN